MRPVSAARVITDLRNSRSPAPGASSREGQAPQEGLQVGALLHDKAVLQQRMEAAHARGVEDGKAAARAEYEAKLEEMRAFHDKQISLERCTWASREADRIAERLDAAVKEMETRLGDTIAELLSPVLNRAIRQAAVSDLLASIEAIVGKDEGLALEVRGPEDLLQLMREKLAGRNLALSFAPADDPEVRVIAGQTIIETQLRAWAAKIEECLR